MSKVYPLAAPGIDSEAASRAIPAQAALRFGDPQRIRDLTSAIVAALRAEIDDTGPAGKALAERVAKRLGVDVGAVRR